MSHVQFKLYSPTIYVGLGGAGSDVVNRIAGKLKKREDWKDIGEIFQFFAIDTDRKDMEKNTHIPQAHRFIISGFDKGRYVEEKLGRAGVSLSKPDPKVAQWVHDWYNFRSSQGAGAGQIRIESRISLYNSFESTDLIKRLEGAIAKTIHMRNSFVDTSIKKMNVMLYFSVAGGTGSGSHLMMAAMLRHLVANMGWSAYIIGINMLPTLFLQNIRNPRQREDILTNGYSALKEVEHLMKLKVSSDDRSSKQEMPFVYHPFIASNTVTDSPFDFIYIIDTTTEINVGDSYKQAVADGVYLQLMSPLFGKRDSDYDNYEKNQKRLSRELFTVHYGSFGCSVLIVPDKDILTYCSQRLATDHLFDYVGGSFSSILNEPEEDEGNEEEQGLKQNVNFFLKINKQAESDKKTLKIFEKLGIQAKFDIEIFIENMDKVAKEDVKNDYAFQEFIETLNYKSFDKDFFFQYLANVYAHLQKKENEEITGFEYKGIRKNFQTFLNDVFFTIIDELWTKHDYTNILKIVPDRQAEKNEERSKKVQDELVYRIDTLMKKIHEFKKDMGTIKSNAAKYFLNPKNVANFFTEQNLNLVSQQIFSIVVLYEHKFKNTILGSFTDKTQNFTDLRDKLKDFKIPSNQKIEDLLDSAKIKGKEWLKILFNKESEQEEYEEDYKSYWGDPVMNIIKEIQNRLYFEALLHINSSLMDGINKYLSNIRNFSNASQEIIETFNNDCAKFKEQADTQSNEFELDVEILQDLNGKRLWEEYYKDKIKGKYNLKETNVIKIINDAFVNDRLLTARDKAEQIREKLMDMAKKRLKNLIVGEYSHGHERAKRGLLVDEGLKLEAELKFIEYLQNVNRWKDEQTIYKQYREQPDEKSESLKAFEQELAHFSRNYLEHKLLKCIRRSGILANVNENDPDVVEFACKQQMIAYDTKLYKAPEQDEEGHFVTILTKIAPEAGEKHLHWEDDSKKVIFYQAILGIPLFTFRNVVGLMKEGYNKRVLERDWQNPRIGRQYPLHIDKNWESDDPFVDPTNLPLNLDPDDAKMRDAGIRSLFNNFFATFLKLTNNGYIIWDEDDGYVIPKGKLGNKKDRVVLGSSTREAVVAILKNVYAHELINQVTAKLTLTKEDIKAKIEELKPFMQRDAWSNEKTDPEAEIIMNMLLSLLREIEQDEKLLAERNRRPNLAKSKTPANKKAAVKS